LLTKGKYPVYSASGSSPLIHIDTYDYDGEFLSWSTNGFAGTISVLNEKFSINGDKGLLLPKNDREDLDLYYLKYILEPVFREMAKGRKGDNGVDEFTKLYPSMLEEIMVPVPIDENGEISLILQIEIAKKYKMIFETTNDVIANIRRVIEQKIKI
jgi:Type I restriction modification DNA specificity domain.